MRRPFHRTAGNSAGHYRRENRRPSWNGWPGDIAEAGNAAGKDVATNGLGSAARSRCRNGPYLRNHGKRELVSVQVPRLLRFRFRPGLVPAGDDVPHHGPPSLLDRLSPASLGIRQSAGQSR